MPYKINDFFCQVCDYQYEALTLNGFCTCPLCGGDVEKLPALVQDVKILGVNATSSQAKRTRFKEIE